MARRKFSVRQFLSRSSRPLGVRSRRNPPTQDTPGSASLAATTVPNTTGLPAPPASSRGAGDLTPAAASAKRVSKTASERDRDRLYISGTEKMDPRQAEPDLFAIEEGGRLRVRTRGSLTKGGSSAETAGPATRARKDSKVDSMIGEDAGVSRRVSGSDMKVKDEFNGSTMDALLERIPDRGSLDAQSGSTKSNASTRSIASQATADIEESGRVASKLSGRHSIVSMASTTISEDVERRKRRHTMVRELATDGAPLTMDLGADDPSRYVEEYFDGRKWYRPVEPGKPDWAVDERTVDTQPKRRRGPKRRKIGD